MVRIGFKKREPDPSRQTPVSDGEPSNQLSWTVGLMNVKGTVFIFLVTCSVP